LKPSGRGLVIEIDHSRLDKKVTQVDNICSGDKAMKINVKFLSCTMVAALLLLATVAAGAEAQIASRSGTIVIVQPNSLPALTRQNGIAFQLYSETGDGSCYLYIEQNQGSRLLVLDVSDPARVRLVNTVPLTVPGPFDFVRTLGSSAFLLRFRNTRDLAVLDLRKPKMPALKLLANPLYSGRTESLGDSAFLAVDEHWAAPAVPQDYQVVDVSNPANPTLLYTVKQVNGKLERADTGTTFLLGSDGLIIIRLPLEEEKHKSAQSYTN
jgi:hypothetical protein